MIYKIKIGRRTQKSAADDPKILAGCFFNPQNVYFEVCMVRAKVVCFMNYANVNIYLKFGWVISISIILFWMYVMIPVLKMFTSVRYVHEKTKCAKEKLRWK